jgi:hypothetical protein
MLGRREVLQTNCNKNDKKKHNDKSRKELPNFFLTVRHPHRLSQGLRRGHRNRRQLLRQIRQIRRYLIGQLQLALVRLLDVRQVHGQRRRQPEIVEQKHIHEYQAHLCLCLYVMFMFITTARELVLDVVLGVESHKVKNMSNFISVQA